MSIDFKKNKKVELLLIAQTLNLEVDSETTRNDLITKIEEYVLINDTSEEQIKEILFPSIEKNTTDVDLTTDQKEQPLENVIKVDNLDLEVFTKKTPFSKLSKIEKEWATFLKDRNMSAREFLTYRPKMLQKEIIESLEKYGY